MVQEERLKERGRRDLEEEPEKGLTGKWTITLRV